MSISRRALRKYLAGAALSGGAAAGTLPPTPQETLGPFFPVRTTAERGFDLTRGGGRHGRPLGQMIEVLGRILRTDRSPVAKAMIEIWQANAAGRYVNPVDKNPAPLDPNCRTFISTLSRATIVSSRKCIFRASPSTKKTC
jgi:protocatechuate 3,4-dioxygenase, beta subunit